MSTQVYTVVYCTALTVNQYSEHNLRHQILEKWEDSMEVNYTYESF